MSQDSSEHFRSFASSLELAIARYGHLTEEKVEELQKKQVEKLIQLETNWRLTLIKHNNCEKAYTAFIAHICDERKNVLTARPFFRERQKVFTKSISVALKKRAWRRLLKFHVNWYFINFVMKSMKWRANSPMVRLTNEIAKARIELVETNLPLAISRSRIFWSRTPKSHLSFMDFISIATEGLLSAVDKFVLPYSKVFCSVAIGRMVGNFIEAYSDTMLHFYPTDRRKIYRANKFMSRHVKGDFEIEQMVTEVNKANKVNSKTVVKQLTPKQLTSQSEITDLVAAATIVSADTKAPGDVDVPNNICRFEAPDDCRPDVRYEKAQTLNAMYTATSKLSLIDKKLLRMKGLDISLTAV